MSTASFASPGSGPSPATTLASSAVAAPPVPAAAPAIANDGQLALAPVRADERISGLDAVRGMALLGILLLNICGFGLPDAAYNTPIPGAGGSTGPNLITWCIITVLAEGKFRAIFSLAFGASVCLLIDRLTRKGQAADAADIHYRRMLWLLVFGLIHSYLIWNGDILFPYAMCGLVLYPFRKLSARNLLIVAGVMLLVMTGYMLRDYRHQVRLHRDYNQLQADEKAGKKLTADQEAAKKEWEDGLRDYQPSADDLKTETDAHLGGYIGLLVHRAQSVYRSHSYPIYMPWPWYDRLVMMFLGMAFLKLGVLNGSLPTKFYAWMAFVSFAIGIPAHAWYVWYIVKNHFDIDAWNLTGFMYEFGRFTAFGYIAVLLLLVKSGFLRPVTRTLAAVGQMAFSNYILTSLICTTIFEGYGFGLYNKLQRYQLYGVVLFVWVVILIVSPIWLRHFRFGPLEWLWRSLTYWKKQPFRIQQSGIA